MLEAWKPFPPPSIIKRSYCRRLWVVQEFAVARKVEVACVTARISYQKLRNALDSIAHILYYLEDPSDTGKNDARVEIGYTIVKAYNSSFSSFIDSIITRPHRYQNSSLNENSLFHVLISSLVLESDYNHPECSDPRDRIFAVLGLADDAIVFDNFPDYRNSCEYVYTEAVKRLLNQGHIDIFSFFQFPRNLPMPTWVPDWRMMTFAPIAYDPWRDGFAFSASGNSHSHQKITSEDSESISLRGTVVDTIKESGSVWHPNWLGSLDPRASQKYLSEIRAFCAQSSRIDLEDEEMETSRIAIADWDRAGDLGVTANTLDSYRRLLTEFTASHAAQQQQSTYDNDTWYRRAMQLLRSSRPFISILLWLALRPPMLRSAM